MKRVSFKTAKAIKEAGYPQYGHCEEYYDSCGKVVDKMCDMRKLVFPCPTYLEVWLWLWREKKIYLNTNTQRKGIVCVYWDDTILHEVKDMKLTDPEESIIAATEYLVNNDLIK